MATDTRRLRVVVTGEASQAQQAIESVGESAHKSETHVSKLSETFSKWSSRATLIYGALAGAAGGMAIQTAAKLELVNVGFTTMLGSGEKAKKFIEELEAFAKVTPFDVEGLSRAAQKFLAMGFSAKDVIPSLRAVGDAVAAMGGSSEQIDMVTTALGQMKAKGKVAGDELLQLTEQGIPALKILADSYHVSTAKMSEMISKGKVLADDAIPKLIKGLESGTKSVHGFGGMMDKQAQTMTGAWSNFSDAVSTNLGKFALQFAPLIRKGLDKATEAVENFFAGISGLGKKAGKEGFLNELGLSLRALVSAFKDPGVTSDGMVGVFEAIGTAAKKLYDVLVDLAGKLKEYAKSTEDVVHWLKEHKATTTALAGAIGYLVAVTLIHEAILKIQSGKTLIEWVKGMKLAVAGQKIWTAQTWLLNAAMDANPIGLIIAALVALAAVIYLLWTHNAKFREIVIKVWTAIKQFIGKTAEWFTTTVFPKIMQGLHFLGGVFSSVWAAIKVAVAFVVDFFLSHVWPVYKAIFTAIGFALKVLYNVVWKPIWILIQIAVKIVVFWVRDVAWPLIKLVFGFIKSGIQLVWAGWKFWWNLIWGLIKNFIAYFQVIWLPRIKAVFNLVKAGAALLWKGIKPIWDNIKRGAEILGTAVVKAFNLMKTGVAKAWSTVKTAALAPINFVIGTVYDKGIMPLWNKVAKAFGIDTHLDYIAPIGSGSSSGGKTSPVFHGLSYGGVMPGYAPRQDTIPAMLSPGEGVLIPEVVRQLGATRILEWNKQGRAGGRLKFADGGIVGWGKKLLSNPIIGGIAGPAVGSLIKGLLGISTNIPGGGLFSGLLKGGVHKLLDALRSWVTHKDSSVMGDLGGGHVMGWQAQWAILHKMFPGLSLMSAFRENAITVTGNRSYHAMGRAVDVSPWMQVFDWIRSHFGRFTKELIFSPAGNRQIWNGRPHTYTGAVRDTHWNHVHWAMDQGGKVGPGWFMGYNGLGKPEKLVNADALPSIGKVEIHVNGAGDPAKVARMVRDELIKLGKRNGNRAMLPT